MKKTSTANNERFWLWELLWTDEQNIKDAVADYNKNPWYKTVRFGLSCLVMGTLLLTAIITKQWLDYIVAGIVMLPVCYFVIRGYRFSYVLLAAYKLYDVALKLQTIKPSAMSIFWLIFWTAIWLGLCITCFRIENARHKTFKDAKKITIADKVMLLVCGIVTVLFIGLTAIGMSDPRYKLEQKYGEKNVEIAEDIYVHAVTIPEMCKESWQGIATAYNEKHNTNATGEDLARGYVQRYMDINGDIISKIPETLIKEFREVAGEETTKTMTAEFVKIGQNVLNTKDVDATVYGAVCYMLLTAEDNTMKISLK